MTGIRAWVDGPNDRIEIERIGEEPEVVIVSEKSDS